MEYYLISTIYIDQGIVSSWDQFITCEDTDAEILALSRDSLRKLFSSVFRIFRDSQRQDRLLNWRLNGVGHE